MRTPDLSTTWTEVLGNLGSIWRKGQSHGTEPLICGMRCCLQVGSVRIELSCRTIGWYQWIPWWGENTHSWYLKCYESGRSMSVKETHRRGKNEFFPGHIFFFYFMKQFPCLPTQHSPLHILYKFSYHCWEKSDSYPNNYKHSILLACNPFPSLNPLYYAHSKQVLYNKL